MKKVITLLSALILFASATVAQCDGLDGAITTINVNKNKLLLNFGDAAAAATFLGMVGGENADVTITDGPVNTIDGPIVTSPNNSEILRVTLAPKATNSGLYSGTVTFNDAVPPFTCGFTNGALPVSLTSFTGKGMEKSILLEWKTASELNNDYFAIERSIDGRNFEQLAEVTGQGTTTESVAYSFKDVQPASATNYYRLRQVDYDGTESFSDIITVNFTDTRSAFKLYPTLVQAEVNLDLTSYENEEVVINILNTTGQIVFGKVVNSNEIITLNLDNLTLGNGFYYAHCQLYNQTLVEKFLVKK